MKQNTIVIENPSEGLLKALREGQIKKAADQEEIRKNWHLYFPKK